MAFSVFVICPILSVFLSSLLGSSVSSPLISSVPSGCSSYSCPFGFHFFNLFPR